MPPQMNWAQMLASGLGGAFGGGSPALGGAASQDAGPRPLTDFAKQNMANYGQAAGSPMWLKSVPSAAMLIQALLGGGR